MRCLVQFAKYNGLKCQPTPIGNKNEWLVKVTTSGGEVGVPALSY